MSTRGWLELQLAATDSGGFDLDGEHPARPEDGSCSRSRRNPGGLSLSNLVVNEGAAFDTVLGDPGRRLGELCQCPVAAAVSTSPRTTFTSWSDGGPPEPHDHRTGGEHDLHGDVSQAVMVSG